MIVELYSSQEFHLLASGLIGKADDLSDRRQNRQPVPESRLRKHAFVDAWHPVTVCLRKTQQLTRSSLASDRWHPLHNRTLR